MYQYHSSVVRNKEETARWVDVDISQMAISAVRNSYRKVYMIVTHELFPDPLAVDLDNCAAEFNSMDNSITISQWLAARGSLSLPTESTVPEVTSTLVKYSDVVAAGYSIEPSHPSGNVGGDTVDPEYVDLRLEKEGVDGSLVYKNCLFSVNGFYHNTRLQGGATCIIDGMESIRVAGQNNVGMLSFRDVGEITSHGLRPNQVFNPHPNGKLFDEVWIKLDEPIGNRTPLLVIGGYLELPSDLYEVVGIDTIRVKMSKYPFLHRYFTSKELIDLVPVENKLVKIDNDPNRVIVSELTKDETIRAYFTLSQTFVVLVDAENLFVEREKLEYTFLPGRYYTRHRPFGPIVTEFGRMPEYLAFPEHGVWVLAIQENLQPTYQFEFADPFQHEVVTNYLYTGRPYEYSAGYHLTIGTDIVTV